jgi:hypothetical protein
MAKKEAPKFVIVRGCINCDSSKELKKRTGHDYGFDHELVAGCVILGCHSYGHDLGSPFIDPEEAIRLARKDGSQKFMEAAKKYCAKVNNEFGVFYRKIGVDLDKMIKGLDRI